MAVALKLILGSFTFIIRARRAFSWRILEAASASDNVSRTLEVVGSVRPEQAFLHQSGRVVPGCRRRRSNAGR